MNNYLGDYDIDIDVYLIFDTADADGASITATIVVADIEVYKQGTGAINLVQRTSTVGFTLDVDHDAMTGTHMVAIDTSDNTDAGFFAAGNDYFVKLNTITVSGQSISKWIGHFSLQNRYSAGALRPTTPGNDLDVTATGAAGIDLANVEGQTSTLGLTNTTVDTVTTNTDMVGTTGAALATVCTEARLSELDAVTAGKMANQMDIVQIDTTTDIPALIATAQADLDIITDADGVILGAAGVDLIMNETLTAHVTADSLAVAIKDTLADTNELQADDVPTLIGTAQADLDIITGASGAILLTATQASIDAIETDTGTTIPGTITTLQGDTDDIQTRLPAALVGGRMDSDVEAINNSTTAAVQLALSANEIESGACEGTPSTTVIQTDLAETQDDIYIGRVVIFTSGNARGEATDITDYTGSTGTITVTALANAPAAADTFILL